MAAAAKAPVFSKYDFENLGEVLDKLDLSGAEIVGTVWACDLKLTIQYNDDDCIHEVTKVESV